MRTAGQRYAVIGSNCFTGSHIVAALLDLPGTEVLAVSRSPEYDAVFLPYKQAGRRQPQVVTLDFRDGCGELLRRLQDFAPSVVINVAALSEVALSYERPVEYFETNTLAVVRLCHALRQQSFLERYIHISSAEIFGACQRPVSETERFYPTTPYAVSKAAADLFIDSLARQFNFPAILIRSTNVFGPHQQLFKIIPRSIINLKLGRRIELHGGGRAIKSFIHIDDVVRGLLKALDQDALGTFHFSVDSDATVADVVRQVCELMGVNFDDAVSVVHERPGQDARYWLDCSRATEQLGWRPIRPFREGLVGVRSWIDSNWDVLKDQPMVYRHKA